MLKYNTNYVSYYWSNYNQEPEALCRQLGRAGDPGAATMCELWPLYRKRHLQRSWLRREGGRGLLSTPPVELYQPLSFPGDKPVSSKKQHQNAGFQVCSYGIIYHLGISATDLSAAALWCPGALSCCPLGRAASTTAEVHERLLHFTAMGWGSAPAAWATGQGVRIACRLWLVLWWQLWPDKATHTWIHCSVHCLKSERALGCGWEHRMETAS